MKHELAKQHFSIIEKFIDNVQALQREEISLSHYENSMLHAYHLNEKVKLTETIFKTAADVKLSLHKLFPEHEEKKKVIDAPENELKLRELFREIKKIV